MKDFSKQHIFSLLPDLRRPARYLGNEKNAIFKSASLRVALCFPDTYEIGMSNLGLSILYHLLNDRPEIACERVFAPWFDMEQRLRETGLPLCSLESGTPLSEFDIVGISIPYELTYTNILTILDLAGIPLYSKERWVPGATYPLILGGGAGAFNPEPVADFFDAILIGDGEEAVVEICETVRKWRGTGEILPQLASLRGLYIPSFFRHHYKPDGTIDRIEPVLEGYKGVEKRSVSDLDKAPYPLRPIVPHTRVVHDRLGVEVQRGCARGCRFCQAGYVYRPERQRSPETVKEIVRHQIASTGQEAVGLVSLSIGDYDCLNPLLKDLVDEHGGRKVGISLPATRVEQLTPQMMAEIRKVRRTGFTIAPEAATDRMRRVINKGNSEENLLTTVAAVFSHGWSLMKFYFMVGLPTETDEDLIAIARLGTKALEIGRRQNRRAEINISLSPLVPKPFTPYQWVGQTGLDECRKKLRLIRSRVTARTLHLKPHRPEASYLEGIFSRGDRRLSALIVTAWKKGCRFDGWEESLRFDLWEESWRETGIEPAFYVERERGREEILPWDHLFTQLDKGWLWNEYQSSLKEVPLEDCSTGRCTQCGVCDFKEVRNRAYEMAVFDENGKAVKKGTTTEIRVYKAVGADPRVGPHVKGGHAGPPLQYSCTFSKTGPAIFLSHLEFVDALRRAVSRANLPVRYSQGFHPLPRISFGPAMAVGKEALDQQFTIDLDRSVDPEFFLKDLNAELPEGVRISAVSSSLPPPSPVPSRPP